MTLNKHLKAVKTTYLESFNMRCKKVVKGTMTFTNTCTTHCSDETARHPITVYTYSTTQQPLAKS